MADPDNPEHGERLKWVGGPFDPAVFDLDEVNRRVGAAGVAAAARIGILCVAGVGIIVWWRPAAPVTGGDRSCGALALLWQPAVTDQGAGQGEKRGQRRRRALVTQRQTPEAQQPRHRPLHDPAHPTQAGLVLDPAAGRSAPGCRAGADSGGSRG